jgi:hypothetical protein
MSGFSFMTYVMILGIAGMLRKSSGIRVAHLFQGPTDWLVSLYLAWLVFTTGEYAATTKAILPFAAFYYVTALSNNTPRKLSIFLTCWVVGLAGAMILAISTPLGFELAPGSDDLTESFLGRLALNTWIFNNPNSLGHGIAALIPAAYLWFTWKRGLASRAMGIMLITGASHVIYLTQSKGAYLCGAAAVTISLLFRKSKKVQIFFLVCAMTIGIGAIKMLPRMETLDSKEGGIAGRLLIWQMAFNAMNSTVSGEGWRKFEAWIDTDDYGLIRKATHGSYVNVGADLGYIGLLLFVGILYSNTKTLYLANVNDSNDDLERCQRLLLSLTASYAASAWMIDRAYHTDFFFLAGAIAAFHRLVLNIGVENTHARENEGDHLAESIFHPREPKPSPVLVSASQQPHFVATSMLPKLGYLHADKSESFHGITAEDSISEKALPMKWRKLNYSDAALITIAMFGVITIWQRLMTSFISF